MLNSINSSGSTGGNGVQVTNTSSGTATPKPVTLTGVNVFSGNSGYGLSIVSYGVITTNNITASNNTNVGAYLINSSADTRQASMFWERISLIQMVPPVCMLNPLG